MRANKPNKQKTHHGWGPETLATAVVLLLLQYYYYCSTTAVFQQYQCEVKHLHPLAVGKPTVHSFKNPLFLTVIGVEEACSSSTHTSLLYWSTCLTLMMNVCQYLLPATSTDCFFQEVPHTRVQKVKRVLTRVTVTGRAVAQRWQCDMLEPTWSARTFVVVI